MTENWLTRYVKRLLDDWRKQGGLEVPGVLRRPEAQARQIRHEQ